MEQDIHISQYHAIDIEIVITRYETMIAKHSLKFISSPIIELIRHEATQSTCLNRNAIPN